MGVWGNLRIPPRGDSAQDPEPPRQARDADAEGSRGFKQATGLFKCARGVKPPSTSEGSGPRGLWEISALALIFFVYHKHTSYHHTGYIIARYLQQDGPNEARLRFQAVRIG